MSKYRPDNWVIIKFKTAYPHYRVLVGWSGGYLDGDSWRLNSGITRVDDEYDHLLFYGNSGSAYCCNKLSYRLRINNEGTWRQLQEIYGDKVEMMPEDTDWLNIDWIIQ